MRYLRLLALLAVGCDEGDGDKTNDDAYYVITYDGCEYLRANEGQNATMAHKGNCKNPIHCYNTPQR